MCCVIYSNSMPVSMLSSRGVMYWFLVLLKSFLILVMRFRAALSPIAKRSTISCTTILTLVFSCSLSLLFDIIKYLLSFFLIQIYHWCRTQFKQPNFCKLSLKIIIQYQKINKNASFRNVTEYHVNFAKQYAGSLRRKTQKLHLIFWMKFCCCFLQKN